MIPFPSGMFGSLVSNPFDNAIVGFSAWNPSFYTVDGSNFLTGFTNIVSGAYTSTTIPGSAVSLVTDGSGKKWFQKSGTANFSGNLSAAQIASLVAAGGVAVVISCQSTSAHSDSYAAGSGCGLSFLYGGNSFAETRKSTNSAQINYDFDQYISYNRGGTGFNIGPVKGLVTGYDDPATNTIETPAYGSASNQVFVIFLKTTGFSFWQGTAPVAIRVSNYRNVSGSALNPSAETAEIASDFSPAFFNSVGALGSVELNIGDGYTATRYDHIGVYPASLGDEYFRQLVDLLLHNKP